jgi:sugar/nucleoside kinase (ribokinase family)
MVVVLGDLLMDYSLRLPDMQMRPEDLHQVTYLELGPGGATNVAITAARLGLRVRCLGEVGDDLFGRILRDSLLLEHIDTTFIRVTSGARTPVANVIVDESGEPAYLGYPGSLQIENLLESWRPPIQEAEALFSDGWVEQEGGPGIILEAFQVAGEAGVPVFFDSGPGNPQVDNSWHQEASALSTVFLGTDREAAKVTGQSDPLIAARALLDSGAKLVILKRGVAGCLLVNETELEIAPGYPVEALDATGAGDSFAGAVIYGYLRGLDLPSMGTLANAAGAAKVQKLGTGHNMPWPAEIRKVLSRYGDGDYDFGLPLD